MRREAVKSSLLAGFYSCLLLLLLIISRTPASVGAAGAGAPPSSFSGVGGGGSSSRKKLPEASSTLLHTHRLYQRFPPHDTALYDVLEVPPNATAAAITKNYRKLTRRLHPDKRTAMRLRRQERHHRQQEGGQSGGRGSDDDEEEAVAREEEIRKGRLEQVRLAYEVLKDDATRVPYHRYGLFDTSQAVSLLTGGGGGRSHAARPNGAEDAALRELLLLMGYDSTSAAAGTSATAGAFLSSQLQQHQYDGGDHHHHHLHEESQHRARVWVIASRLLETIRPVVEGAVGDAQLADYVAQEADRLKALPLGAQIVRCVGRAYRHAGQRALRQIHKQQQRRQRQHGGGPAAASSAAAAYWHGRRKMKPHQKFASALGLESLAEGVRDRYRDAKHVLTAAVASGKVVVTENLSKYGGGAAAGVEGGDDPRMLAYHFDDHWDGDDHHADVPSEEEMKERERSKAQRAMLESLQVDALWKICKIDLDRTVREACELILNGDYFFYPSHGYDHGGGGGGGYCPNPSDGWVGSGGIAIDADVGRMRAAAILVMIGDVMVRRSKEGTSWIE